MNALRVLTFFKLRLKCSFFISGKVSSLKKKTSIEVLQAGVTFFKVFSTRSKF